MEVYVNVSIKNFPITMDIKNNGIELDVYDNEVHLGDLVVSKSRLVWCQGKTKVANGKAISWKEFIAYMNSRP